MRELLTKLKAIQLDRFLLFTGLEVPKDLPIASRQVIKLMHEDIFNKEYTNKGRTQKLVPGNTDLAVLAFKRKFPKYRNYWFIEYDVWFRHDVQILDLIEERFPKGLLVVRPFPAPPHWRPGRTIVQGDPLDGSKKDDNLKVTGSLFCMSRYPTDFLDLISSLYERGWSGHHEAFCPTVAKAFGVEVLSVSECARAIGVEDLYTSRSFDHATCEADERASVFHPVKTLQKLEEIERDIRRLSR